MVGPSKSRPPMSHRKTDLGIPCRSKSAKVVLGAGSISTYLGRAMPDAQIDVVELDPGVIAAGKKYFGLRETDKVRFIESDGRVYLNRHKDAYHLILLDAFRELGVPFHMLTREFYALVKSILLPEEPWHPTWLPIQNFTFRLWSPCIRCSPR